MLNFDPVLHIQVKRWFDEVSYVPEAISATKHLPKEFQDKVAVNLNGIINRQINVKKATYIYQAEMVPNILNLYQSYHHNRRWYDKKPQLRRAFNMMEMLPEELLTVYSLKIMKVNALYQEILADKPYLKSETGFFKNKFDLKRSSLHAEIDSILKIQDETKLILLPKYRSDKE